MTDDFDPDEAARQLVRMGYTVSTPEPAIPVAHCALCGISDDDNVKTYGGHLIPVRVNVNIGEEGYSDVTRFYCDEHIDDVANALLPLGLGSHHHGSTTLIEANSVICGGWERCTLYDPEHYEEVYYDGPLHP